MSNEKSSILENDEATVFVEFYYTEIKDLNKHFLTLISATLVASVTFADKIIPFSTATTTQRWTLTLSWLALLTALLTSGLYLLFIAAEKVRGEVIFSYKSGLKKLARLSALFLDFSAIAYGSGLLLLSLTAVLRLFG